VICALLAFTLLAFIPAGRAEAADTPLVQAIKRGDGAAARALLERRGAASSSLAVNAADPTGTTALHWAVQGNLADVTRRLLQAGANVRAANRYGVTPLQLAAVNGNASMVGLLLEAGADPNAVLPEGETVLMTAARTGAVDVLTVLLDRGADIHARERLYGETALVWAAAENHPEAVRTLIARGAPVDSRSSRQEFPRRRSGQSVLSLGGWTPLMYAARENALGTGRALITAGADLNLADPDGATALVVAIINAHYDFAAVLLGAGADPNVVDTEAGMGPLYAAIDMRRLAVGHGRPNPKSSSDIDALGVVRMLLERKADPNAPLRAPIFQRHHTSGDSALGKGATPLMRAAKSGDVEVMTLLLAAGANHQAALPSGAIALMFAAGLGWRDGSPAAPSFDQGTDEDATQAIDLLLGLGIAINAATTQGDTALHVAVTGRGSPLIVRHLVAKGADLGAKNKRGQTPLEAATASRKDLSALVAILRAAASSGLRPDDAATGR
jgi:ankyrin repeat protein